MLAVGGGIAYAAIPTSTGVIRGCYQMSSGSLRVIGTNPTVGGGKCSAGEKALDWSQRGPTAHTNILVQLANGIILEGGCTGTNPQGVEIVLARSAAAGTPNVDAYGFVNRDGVVGIGVLAVDFTGITALHGHSDFEQVTAHGASLGAGNGCRLSWFVTPGS